MFFSLVLAQNLTTSMEPSYSRFAGVSSRDDVEERIRDNILGKMVRDQDINADMPACKHFINEFDRQGGTLLHWAISFYQPAAVRALVAAGANWNIRQSTYGVHQNALKQAKNAYRSAPDFEKDKSYEVLSFLVKIARSNGAGAATVGRPAPIKIPTSNDYSDFRIINGGSIESEAVPAPKIQVSHKLVQTEAARVEPVKTVLIGLNVPVLAKALFVGTRAKLSAWGDCLRGLRASQRQAAQVVAPSPVPIAVSTRLAPATPTVDLAKKKWRPNGKTRRKMRQRVLDKSVAAAVAPNSDSESELDIKTSGCCRCFRSSRKPKNN